ncbi:MAG: carbohydrate ABC transporter permease [Ignavibacteriales bacterium]|jgi:putative chitobiose transport system permease protein|nr:carbohydrate ABC transporter permease [Ignavibacteriaceae bacterium]NLH61351.1 carbohydrate ABC transporter permease [Ignavibacteriales bacterium]HOJ18611.1 carbohydrate ABC transporter permease [Ignavibacteriaceae bacterium]HPO56947.1 carbohydrate ABC transporter permease [Ignavibacteriaceae bacterium]
MGHLTTRLFRLFLLLFFALIAVFPFLWLLSTSLKGSEELFAFPPDLIPQTLNFENYSGAFNSVPFGDYFINSFIIVSVTVMLNLLISSLAGYGLARFSFKGRELIFLLIVASLMIPKEIIIIPLYVSILKLNLADSLVGVIIPFAVEGFAIYMMRQAFLSIPKEIEEAAVMDGCGFFKMWWTVMLPMTKPTLITLAIFTFIGTWGDFLWPLIVLKSPENYTLQVGLSYMMGTFVNNYRYVAAGSVIAIIPVLILFLASQKHFQRGLFMGSGK